jgi:hypothetical protein
VTQGVLNQIFLLHAMQQKRWKNQPVESNIFLHIGKNWF